jgi:hypothetical protein
MGPARSLGGREALFRRARAAAVTHSRRRPAAGRPDAVRTTPRNRARLTKHEATGGPSARGGPRCCHGVVGLRHGAGRPERRPLPDRLSRDGARLSPQDHVRSLQRTGPGARAAEDRADRNQGNADSGWTVCFRANAKNRAGAYAGVSETVLLIRGERVVAALDDPSPTHYDKRTNCGGAKYERFSEMTEPH